MSSLNKVMLIGRLGQDPETRDVNGTTVANFSVATTETWKDKEGEKKQKTEWHRIVVWGRQAEIAEQYLTKGSQVYLEGQLQTRQYQVDGEDKPRYTTEIRVNNFRMLGSRQDQNNNSSSEESSAGAVPPGGSNEKDKVPF